MWTLYAVQSLFQFREARTRFPRTSSANLLRSAAIPSGTTISAASHGPSATSHSPVASHTVSDASEGAAEASPAETSGNSLRLSDRREWVLRCEPGGNEGDLALVVGIPARQVNGAAARPGTPGPGRGRPGSVAARGSGQSRQPSVWPPRTAVIGPPEVAMGEPVTCPIRCGVPRGAVDHTSPFLPLRCR